MYFYRGRGFWSCYKIFFINNLQYMLLKAMSWNFQVEELGCCYIIVSDLLSRHEAVLDLQ